MKSRMRYSIMNSSISAFIYLLRLILGFISRTYFIHLLGVEILGLNGLFTNILSFLSLAELGIGTSIVFELYKPIASGDKETIKSLMKLYKKAYDFIGVIIAVVGICILPVLPIIIKNGNVSSSTYIYYILFLGNSVISYFFTYKRSLLNADQKNYITVINDFIFYMIGILLQILILILFKSYFWYLVIQILVTLISNIWISVIVNKRYPYILEKTVKEIDPKIKKELGKNVIGNLSSQIGSVVVLGSDNILLSSFIGLTVVGLYSNYTLITNAVKGVLQQATNSVVPSVGNMIVQVTREKAYNTFKLYLFVNSSVSYITGVGVFAVINNFIRIWIGKNFLLPYMTVLLIALNLTVLMYQGAARTFISGYGLFWSQRWKPIFEAAVNIIFSLIFLLYFHLGVNGVLLGTMFSSILVIMWFEPYVLFKYGFKRSVYEYVFFTILFYLKFILSVIVITVIGRFFIVNNLTSFLIFSVVQIIVLMLLYFILFGFNSEFKELFKRIVFKFKL